LYQLLTGSVPFPAGDTTQKFQARLKEEPKDARIFNQTIPFDIADLLRSMLAKHPSRRTATAQEVADRLDAWGTPFF
jgi:serine/threonine protein kinase